MAPISLATANAQFDKAITKLMHACVVLDHQLPPQSEEDLDTTDLPSLRPHQQQETGRTQQRGNSVAQCPMCAAELEVMEPGAREGHVCTHGDLGNR